VYVRDNNVDQALRALKRKMQREGVFREMKQRRFYEKPSERAAREKSEAIRRGAQTFTEAGAERGLDSNAPEESAQVRTTNWTRLAADLSTSFQTIGEQPTWQPADRARNSLVRQPLLTTPKGSCQEQQQQPEEGRLWLKVDQ
jgi:small subunit ribosomal protein S21